MINELSCRPEAKPKDLARQHRGVEPVGPSLRSGRHEGDSRAIDLPGAAGPLRTCIVTGEQMAPERMIRFVVGPEDEIVPDLARRLPGRGLWLKAWRAIVEQAVTKKLFARAARGAVKAADDLPIRVERLLLERALEDLARARRAGRAVSGFVRVEQMIGQNRAGLLLVAEAADGAGDSDGLGKLRSSGVKLERLGDEVSLGGVFGRDQTVYAAVARDDASGRFIERIAGGAARWRCYRLNGAGLTDSLTDSR